MAEELSWLLLLYALPAHRNTQRVAIWRRLQKIGALQLKTSAYLLPDRTTQHEQFQWLAKQIRDAGGEATLVQAHVIEGISNEKLVVLFNRVREKEYAAIGRALYSLQKRRKKAADEEIERLTKRFRAVREIDFFESPRAQEIGALLAKVAGPGESKAPPQRVDPKAYRGRTWVTRPRPQIDRVGSAWLIRKFIDPKARFTFAPSPAARPKAVSFDMLDSDFTHYGKDCTFETLVKRFGIHDKLVRKIAEMVHDADLDDGKFQRTECIGIDRVLKGWAEQGLSDDHLLRDGFRCFDALYTFLQRM